MQPRRQHRQQHPFHCRIATRIRVHAITSKGLAHRAIVLCPWQFWAVACIAGSTSGAASEPFNTWRRMRSLMIIPARDEAVRIRVRDGR